MGRRQSLRHEISLGILGDVMMYLTSLKTAFFFALLGSLTCWSTRRMFQLFRKNGFLTHVQSQRHSSPPLTLGSGAFLKPQPGKSSSSSTALTTLELRANQNINILRWSNQLASVNRRSPSYDGLSLQHLVMGVGLIKTHTYGKVVSYNPSPNSYVTGLCLTTINLLSTAHGCLSSIFSATRESCFYRRSAQTDQRGTTT